MAGIAIVPLLAMLSEVLQTAIKWILFTCWGLASIAIAALLSRWRTTEAAHQKELEEVARSHCDNMQVYEQIAPLNRPPLSVYALYASSFGVFDGLPNDHNQQSLLDRFVSRNHPGEGLLPRGNGRVNNELSQQRQQVHIINLSHAVVQVTCKEVPSYAEYIYAGQNLALPYKMPGSATVVMEGYQENRTTFDFTVHLDRCPTCDIKIYEANGQVDFAHVAR